MVDDHTFTELLGLLQDQKPEVRRFAAETVLSQTEDPDFLDFCKREPRRCARPLLRLAEKAEQDSAEAAAAAGGYSSGQEKSEKVAAIQAASNLAAGVHALKCLVNLSAVPAVAEELVSLNAPKRLTEALRAGWLEGRAQMAHWYSMLLANVSTCKKGQEALCADEGMLKFLVAAYLTTPRLPARDGYEDPLLWLGAVLVNVLVLPEGRKLLAIGKSQELEMLFGEMSDRSRRADMVNAAKNVCLDMDCHEALVATDLMLHMARFLCPWDTMDTEHRSALPSVLRESLEKEGAALTGDLVVRSAAAVCCIGLCRSLAGREYLRTFVQVFRSWKEAEPDATVKDNLEVILPAVVLSEEELSEHQKLVEQDKPQPSA